MSLTRRTFMTAPTLGFLPSVFGERVSAFARRRVAQIDWYYEARGRGAPIVLIPSGEGDCGSFERTAELLARRFRVLTFDMPGFSRSSDPPDFAHYSMTRAAAEIAALVRALDVEPATFYGCSSGGHIALCLAAEHRELVRNVVVHEVAGLATVSPARSLTELDDDAVVATCIDRFRNQLNESPQAWDALGSAYRQRLKRNYVTWVRRYIAPERFRTFTPSDLRVRPLTWTTGRLSLNADRFAEQIALAKSAGIAVGSLPCRHFPQVSIPDQLADHITATVSSGFPAL